MWSLLSVPLRILHMLTAAICVGVLVLVLWLYSVVTSENILEESGYAIRHSK